MSALNQLLSKLPRSLQVEWRDVSWSLQPDLPTKVDFDTWLDNKVIAALVHRVGIPLDNKNPKQRQRPHRVMVLKQLAASLSRVPPNPAGKEARVD